MYEKVVKDLREAERVTNGRITLWGQAADAIEELTRIIHEYQKFDGFLAAHGMFKQEPMRTIRDDRGQLLFYPSAEPPKEETE